MDWIMANTPEDAAVLVIAGEAWPLDAAGEWFPLLAERRSLSTVQGSEWMGRGEFETRRRRHAWLLNCATRTSDNCVAEWSRVVEQVDYVLVAVGPASTNGGEICCRDLVHRVVADGGEVVFANATVTVASLGP
jgi:hypothetical protein